MEFADRDLITQACSKHRGLLRFTRPRSDLSCHHFVIAQATIGETSSSAPFHDVVIRPIRLCARASGGIVGSELTVIGQQRPRDPGILVGLRDRRHVRVATTHEAFEASFLSARSWPARRERLIGPHE